MDQQISDGDIWSLDGGDNLLFSVATSGGQQTAVRGRQQLLSKHTENFSGLFTNSLGF